MPRLMIAGVLLMVAQVSTPQCGETGPSSPSSPSSSASSTPSPSVDVAAAPNVLAVSVTAGPTNTSLNQPFVAVTLCVPGTSNCQLINNVLVDTGSNGLRVLSSALTLSLPQQAGPTGAPIVECYAFVNGVTWGPVQTADIRLSGEQASSAPVQVIGGDRFPAIPGGCTSRGPSIATQGDILANGILGIGMLKQDCGTGCTFAGASNPGVYYACPTPATCQVTTVPIAQQVQNPVALFPTDNNGVLLRLPAIPAGGAPSAFGALIFGIGTQSNNQFGSATKFMADARQNFTTTFNGQSYPRSFIDSGSNGIFFLDAATTGLPACTRSSNVFYCPPAARAFTATQVGANGTSAAVSFSAGNIDGRNGTFSVFGEATGANAGGFNWGLPFFFGRSVFTAIEGQSTPAGPGPYWAY